MQALAKQLSVFAGVTELRDGLVKRGMRDIVCDKLQMLIASGVLQVGDVLPGERELAAALGVSRETVRGAVQTLAVRPGAIQQSYREHVAIVDALREHDEPAVVAAFDAQLKRIYQTTRLIMRDAAPASSNEVG